MALRFVLLCSLLFMYIHRSLEPLSSPASGTEAPLGLVNIQFVPHRLSGDCGSYLVVTTEDELTPQASGQFYWLRWLLLVSGDIGVNPGPVYRYPCTLCAKPVEKNQRGIGCDRCDRPVDACCLLWSQCQ